MEDQQKKMRLIIMSGAGVLLIAVCVVWMMNQKENEGPDETNGRPLAQQTNQVTAQTTPQAQENASAPAGSENSSTAVANKNTDAAAPATPTSTPAPASTAAANTTAANTTPANTAPANTTPPRNPGGMTNLAGFDSEAETVQAAPKAEPPKLASLPPAQGPADAAPTQQSGPRAKGYAATRREEAVSVAKQVAGREDPMQAEYESNSYPAPWTKLAMAGGRTTSDDQEKDKKGEQSKIVPPPPPPSSREAPVPPPPPVSPQNMIGADSLPIDNLPLPPDKPLVSPNLKLVAIVGNRAMLSVPMQMRTQNKWPAIISLAPGERFEDPVKGSFSVVSVEPDNVTIEEESERSVKTLPQIK